MGKALSRAAANLVLAVAATPAARISSAILHDEFEDVAAELDGNALLQKDGHDFAATSLADHDDAPISVTWSPQDQSWGYFSPIAGWVAVPEDRLHQLSPEFRYTSAARRQRALLRQGHPLHANHRGAPMGNGQCEASGPQPMTCAR